MIGVKLNGRLGNQMFQYAFAVTASKKKNSAFFLVKEGEAIEMYKYFKLDKTFFYRLDLLLFNYRGFRLFFSHYLRNIFYSTIGLGKKKRSVPMDSAPAEVLDSIEDGTIYDGFFQSPLYFKANEQEVLNAFQLKKHLVHAYNEKYKFPGDKKKVTIHIRRTDYTELAHLGLGQSDLTLPFAYYHRVIKQIHSADNFYVFIADDPAAIADEFAYVENKIISADAAIMDFQHMLTADICVIANSTFSWWAAYLNAKPGKEIYCPEYFLGFHVKKEFPKFIYPPEWKQIEVPGSSFQNSLSETESNPGQAKQHKIIGRG